MPCPFCGERESLYVEHLAGTIVRPAHRVLCDNCGASTGYTDKDHVESWNRRALATANGAEGLPEAVLDAALLDMFPGDHSAYLRVNWRDTMRRVLTAAILATRPQAASDGEAVAKVMAFVGDLVPSDYNEWGDIDGFTLEELCLKHGLLVRERREAPCGENCACYEMASDNIVDCNRHTPLLRACFKAADAAMTTDAAKGDDNG